MFNVLVRETRIRMTVWTLNTLYCSHVWCCCCCCCCCRCCFSFSVSWHRVGVVVHAYTAPPMDKMYINVFCRSAVEFSISWSFQVKTSCINIMLEIRCDQKKKIDNLFSILNWETVESENGLCVTVVYGDSWCSVFSVFGIRHLNYYMCSTPERLTYD